MIVKDLFKNCSKKKVLDLVLERHKKIYGNKPEKAHRALRAAYRNVLHNLSRRMPLPSEFLLLKISYIGDGEFFEQISLFSKEEVKEKKENFVELENLDEKKEYSYEEIEAIQSLLPRSYSSSFIPWSKVLGHEVNEENVKEYGKESILADILYDITFFGFSEKEMKEEKEKLDKILSEIKEKREKMKEEIENFGSDIDTVFAELGLRDERTEEEKEEAERRMKTEMVLNAKLQGKIFKKLF